MKEEILAYLNERHELTELDESWYSKAAKDLNAGDPEETINVLVDALNHAMRLAMQNPDRPNAEGEKDAPYWIAVGEDDVERISRWLKYLRP